MTGSKTRSAAFVLSLVMLCATPGFAEDPPAVPPPGTLPPATSGAPVAAPQAAAAAPAPAAPLPELSLDYDFLSGSLDNGLLEGSAGKPVRLNYCGEFFIEADRVAGDLTHQRFSATGSVKAYDKLIVISADSLVFSGAERLGFSDNALIYQRPYRIQAGRIDVTPVDVVVTDGYLSTAPPGVSPDFELRASKITLFQDPRIPTVLRGRAENASFYLFHNRVLTLRKVKFRSGATASGPGAETTVVPAFGYSGRYGLFSELRYRGDPHMPIEAYLLLPTRQSPQAQVTAHQTLIAGRIQSPPTPAIPPRRTPLDELHQFEQAASPPLPFGDPLLFHDFLQDTPTIRPFDSPSGGGLYLAEEASAHLSASGRRRDDLYVSRLPELRLNGALPLTRVHAAPALGDPVAFRQFLRRPVVYLTSDFITGRYYEQPTGIRGQRDRIQVGLSTRPWLIAKNTLVLPSIENTYNHYDKSKSLYQYTQTNLAVAHYFTDRSALSVEYRTSKVTGDSPFNFDVLDTSREVITRGQIGNHNIALSTLVRYDLVNHDVLDYRVTVAPTMHGFIPTFTYNFRERSLNINFEVEGISF
ncbi:hypothetical protein CCAX7_52600 [Capsulimonas corticalis]|uniref:Uncharacterized protein n=1 Tax=Capsulimonas corticalis TaxID=2219043 RepID=A0A402CP41_9BACT|nr:hypothetical protein [Capsulimonas corticalis]BDI33209.1 hypothetical protein CCAX7_52600 [Capsulimonas corticalis]